MQKNLFDEEKKRVFWLPEKPDAWVEKQSRDTSPRTRSEEKAVKKNWYAS